MVVCLMMGTLSLYLGLHQCRAAEKHQQTLLSQPVKVLETQCWSIFMVQVIWVRKMVWREACSASVCFLLVTKRRAQGDLCCCGYCTNESHPHPIPWKLLSVHCFSTSSTPDFIGQQKYCTSAH